MSTPMTKRAFLAILERRRNSGLTIKEFCLNEDYPLTSYYYWKRKFHTSVTETSGSCEKKGLSEDFAPVRLPPPKRFTTYVPEELSKGVNEIMIELPAGIKIYFRGSHKTKVAIGLISQICSSHVLPH